MAQQPPVGQGLLIMKASRSYSDTLHSVGPLWTGTQPDAVTSICQQHSQETGIRTLGGIRTHIPNNLTTADLRLRRRRYGNRQLYNIHSFSSLSYDRSKVPSKASSPHSAIQSFLLKMRVSSPFLVIQ
jgi:hypothetical protein